MSTELAVLRELVDQLCSTVSDALADRAVALDHTYASEYERLRVKAGDLFPQDGYLQGLPVKPDRATEAMLHRDQTAVVRWTRDNAVRLKTRLSQLSPQIEPSATALSQKVYTEKSQFDAYRDIKRIFASAERNLTIVDNYVNEEIVDMIAETDAKVLVRLLTWKMQGSFQLAAKKLNQQRGKLEVRLSAGEFHDRFVIADDDCYHIGASIKDAGSKTFMISLLQDAENRRLLLENIESNWARAARLD